jgi:hypothetical protein
MKPFESECVELKLPVPERDVIVTCAHAVENGLRQRVQKTPAREVVSFTIEELEDLHRGLAYDANQTLDKKRAKTIQKVLRKIEEVLAIDEDGLENGPFVGELDDELPAGVPQSAQQVFDDVFGGPRVGAGAMQPCPLTLTPTQRKTLLGMDTITIDLHKMLSIAPPTETEFSLSPRQFMVLSLAIKEAIATSLDEKSAQPYIEIGESLSNRLFEALDEEADLDVQRRYQQSQSGPAKFAFQLKVTLEGSKPPIWRRIQIADCTLDVLHHLIQAAMGWTNSHLHMFQYGEDRFSDPRFELDTGDDDYDETQVFVGQLAADGRRKLRYWYDFGDDWWHTITFEKMWEPKPTEKFPVCVKGVGACPPEDCGGIWGYYDMLGAIRDPKHERHAEIVEWIGADFEPNTFDINEANKTLAAGPVEFDEDAWA